MSDQARSDDFVTAARRARIRALNTEYQIVAAEVRRFGGEIPGDRTPARLRHLQAREETIVCELLRFGLRPGEDEAERGASMTSRRVTCQACGLDCTGQHFMCDEECDGAWCPGCFDATACGRGEHGEGCATGVFSVEPAKAERGQA